MTRHPRPAAPRSATPANRPQPDTSGWLLLTEADRAMATLGDALARTSRWQDASH